MNPEGELVDRSTVRLERLLPGPIDRVWTFLTRREGLSRWFAVGDIELHVGGKVELSQCSDDVPIRTDGIICGTVTRCEPPYVLAYTWTHVSAAEMINLPCGAQPIHGPESEVCFELKPVGDQVRLTVTHRRLERPALPQVGAGWHTHLTYLSAALSDKPADPFLDIFLGVLPHYREIVERRFPE